MHSPANNKFELWIHFVAFSQNIKALICKDILQSKQVVWLKLTFVTKSKVASELAMGVGIRLLAVDAIKVGYGA